MNSNKSLLRNIGVRSKIYKRMKLTLNIKEWAYKTILTKQSFSIDRLRLDSYEIYEN